MKLRRNGKLSWWSSNEGKRKSFVGKEKNSRGRGRVSGVLDVYVSCILMRIQRRCEDESSTLCTYRESQTPTATVAASSRA